MAILHGSHLTTRAGKIRSRATALPVAKTRTSAARLARQRPPTFLRIVAMDRNRSTLLNYLIAFERDWVALMSGIASVILAIIGAALEKTIPPWTFWLASASCLVWASYRVWLREHNKVSALEGTPEKEFRVKDGLALLTVGECEIVRELTVRRLTNSGGIDFLRKIGLPAPDDPLASIE